MIDKETFKKTEGKLYRYYKSKKKIESFRAKIDLLQNDIRVINNRIKNIDFTIPVESKSIGFDERVQTSSDGISYAERSMIQIIDRLEREIVDNTKEIERLEELIRKINKDNKIIEVNIKWLGKEQLNYLECKYKDELKNWEIANKLNVSEVTCTRIRNKLIEDVSKWEDSLLMQGIN